MTITVLGTGYVGLTTATLLAHSGHTVYAVEPNQERLRVIKTGKSFFYEAGLDPLVKKAVDEGTLKPTDSYKESVPHSDIIFSCVGTPDNPDGSSNLRFVFAAAEEAAVLMKSSAIYVQKSTVPVGTGAHVEEVFKKANKPITYVSNPEFLREGTALEDSLFFDRIIVGTDNANAAETVSDLYKSIEQHRTDIARLAGIVATPAEGRYITTSRNSAELIKVTANAALALKISFANSIALLADKAGADINEVMDAVGADPRIERAFLNAGRGYGGGCFPKDVSGLIASGLEYGVDLEIMEAAQRVNTKMPGYIVEKLQGLLGGNLKGKKIGVLGLAFKPGTSDVRRSPGIKITRLLSKAGATVLAYDPEANEEAAPDLRRGTSLASSVDEAVTGADAVVVATEWPEFTEYDAHDFAAKMKGKLFFDAMNAYTIQKIEAAGLTYIGVGRNGAKT